MEDLKKALEGDDIDEIKEKREALLETTNALATKVYEEAAKASQAASESKDDDDDDKDSKKDGDVMDAEFEEK